LPGEESHTIKSLARERPVRTSRREGEGASSKKTDKAESSAVHITLKKREKTHRKIEGGCRQEKGGPNSSKPWQKGDLPRELLYRMD